MDNPTVRHGTFLGVVFSMIHLLPWDRLFETIVLAAVGACVSFLVSRLLQRLQQPKS